MWNCQCRFCKEESAKKKLRIYSFNVVINYLKKCHLKVKDTVIVIVVNISFLTNQFISLSSMALNRPTLIRVNKIGQSYTTFVSFISGNTQVLIAILITTTRSLRRDHFIIDRRKQISTQQVTPTQSKYMYN